MISLGFGILLLLVWCAVDLCARAGGRAWRSPWAVLAALGAALLLLRPHGDTFTALDHSGYRLMAQAFANGRGANDIDQMVLQIPPEAVQDCTLLPRTEERNTRDRSFLLRSDSSGETEPFFYPVLPMGAAALQRIWPWGGMDLFVPLVGLLFACGLLAVGSRAAGGGGIVLAAALFVGSPLPSMLLRGFYAEVCGAALAGLATTVWLLPTGRDSAPLSAYVALGLAPAFHPILLVVSLPLLAAFVSSGRESALRVSARLLGFGLGPVFVWWLTEHVCAPYGRISWGQIRYNFGVSQSHQIAYVFIAGSGAVLGGLLLWRMLHPASFRKAVAWLKPGARAWVLVSFVPIIFSLLVWSESARVRAGLSDLWSAVGWPFGVLIAICGVTMLFRAQTSRERFVGSLALAVLPVFAYLKGAEQMGMWSQRRLVPVILILIPSLLSSMVGPLRRLRSKSARLSALAGVVIVTLGAYNVVRWPAPYFIRQEQGALERVQALKARMENRLVFFDYLPDSFPFTVDGKTRAIGWNPKGRERAWEAMMFWLAEQAKQQEVWIVSSYSSPGMEEGVVLKPLSVEIFPTVRVHSKKALPAERQIGQRRMEFVALEPSVGSPPTLHKHLDGGPLALRGPWGPLRSVVLPDACEIGRASCRERV